ncbi:ATP-dependent RNA helicase dbp4 [Chytridiales sp. JEL 0842]|nr:ATP-dependent RNA helicase dbp4 [Chytridiales sp. JEL 0842]
MFQQKNTTIMSEHYQKLREADDLDEDAGENFFGLVRADHDVDGIQEQSKIPLEAPTRQQLLRLKKKEILSRGSAKKTEFDEDGNPITFTLETLEQFEAKESIESRRERHLVEQSKGMKEADAVDKETARAKRREARLLKKMKEKARREEEAGGVGEVEVTLGGGNGEYDSGSEDNEEIDESEFEEEEEEANEDDDPELDFDMDEDDDSAPLDINMDESDEELNNDGPSDDEGASQKKRRKMH